MYAYRKRNRRGANAIEFALIAPILVMLLFGTMEYSWLFMTQITLDAAVIKGVHTASTIDPDETDPGTVGEVAAEDYWTGIGLQGDPAFSSWSSSSTGDNTLVTVSASLPYPSLFGGVVPSPGNLRSTSSGRLEAP